jgi:hypothetical protein
VRKRTLNVTCANVSGAVLLAIADTLLHLLALKLIFWQAFSLSPLHDFPVLERLGALNMLVIQEEFCLRVVLPTKR